MLSTSLSLPDILSVLDGRTGIWPVDLVPAHTWGRSLLWSLKLIDWKFNTSSFPTWNSQERYDRAGGYPGDTEEDYIHKDKRELLEKQKGWFTGGILFYEQILGLSKYIWKSKWFLNKFICSLADSSTETNFQVCPICVKPHLNGPATHRANVL